MTSLSFLSLIDANKPVLADGAMGTYLHETGISFDACFDGLNLTQPALIANVHREYIEAGAQIILSNTFGANAVKLSKHGLKDQLSEINKAGVELAHKVVDASFKKVLIAGDVGPIGVRLAPFGRVQPEEARRIFLEQIHAIIASKVDLLVFETFTDKYEMREAIHAAKQVDKNIPIVASMTFTRDDRTLLGDNPRKIANALADYGADVIGINCSGGPNQLNRILCKMRSVLPDGKFWVKPNAGWPEQLGGRIFYPASPDYFGDYARAFWQAGANVIGGCCGTTPAHIQAMRKVLDSTDAIVVDQLPKNLTGSGQFEAEQAAPTELAGKLAKGKFVIAVEMDPPRGLSTKKLLAGASLLADAGADVIDVADSPMARMRMSPWAVCSLIQRRAGIETVLHFPTRGRNLLRVQGDLLAAHALDVRNIFVIMGDPTAIGDYPDAMDNYDLVPSGLVKLIKQNFNAGVDHAGTDIGQPTSFFAGAALNLNAPDPQRELKVLRRKIKGGADFLLTQAIYDIAPLIDFVQRYRDRYGECPLPILVGILPLASDRHAAFLHQEVPGIHIAENIHQHMRAAGENGAREGIKIAIDLVEKLKNHAQGIYLMPAFNRFDYAAEIIESIQK